MNADRDEHKRDWRYPEAEEPRRPDSWWEDTRVLLILLAGGLAILFARSQGWMP